jgi:hypothetical protein
MNRNSTPLIMVMMYLTGVVQLLVEGMNLYYWQYLYLWDEGTSSVFLMLQCLVRVLS